MEGLAKQLLNAFCEDNAKQSQTSINQVTTEITQRYHSKRKSLEQPHNKQLKRERA
jgi:hypothetical protein